MSETNLTQQIQERMTKIGGRRRNFMRESQNEEMKQNDKIVIYSSKDDGGIRNVDLTLEPDKFDQLSSSVRLTLDEYCIAIDDLIDEEESEWEELRMKDMVNITRDRIMLATIMKYAKEHYQIVEENYTGKDINYTKRYDEEGRFIGEAVVVTLTMIPMMGAVVK